MSQIPVGNDMWQTSKGNYPFGDDWAVCREIQPDLRHKIYCICYPLNFSYHNFGDELLLKDDLPRNQKIKFKPTNSKKTDKSWIIKTIIITFTMSGVFSLLSSGIMNLVSIWVAVLILLFIILMGIVFDIIGMAVATAQEAPFHSMAAKRVKHASLAISLIKENDKVSNFCNDVVGDICGIVSGSASAAVVAYLIKISPVFSNFLFGLVITALVAALTVGGKALGKTFAIKHSNSIVYNVARIISALRFWSR